MNTACSLALRARSRLVKASTIDTYVSAPPTYGESALIQAGDLNLRDDGDNEHIHRNWDYVPKYMMYRTN